MIPQFAKVRFSDTSGVDNKKLYTKEISDIKVRYEKRGRYFRKPFQPEDKNDFNKNINYRVRWHCDPDCEENHKHEQYLPAQILFLAGMINIFSFFYFIIIKKFLIVYVK